MSILVGITALATLVDTPAGQEGDRNSDRTGAYPWSSLQDISPLSRSSASPTSQAVCASSNRLAALLALTVLRSAKASPPGARTAYGGRCGGPNGLTVATEIREHSYHGGIWRGASRSSPEPRADAGRA